jgi:protein O-mannosyl-transferase
MSLPAKKRKTKPLRGILENSALSDASSSLRARSASHKRTTWLFMGFIAVLLVSSYSNSLRAPLIYDDIPSILENPTIQSLWPFSSSMWGPKDTPTAGRPVINFSLAINYWLGKTDVFGYHLTNLAIHLANAILLGKWLALALATVAQQPNQRLLPIGTSTAAWLVAAIWACHPLQSEAVTYLTQRTELIMAFFLLLTLYTSHRAWEASSHQARLWCSWLSVASSALGMASKEVMVVAPILVVLSDWLIHRASLSDLWNRRRFLYLALAATWAVLIILLATNPRGKSVGFSMTYSVWLYFTTQCWAIGHYLRLTFWPVGLSGDYGVIGIQQVNMWGPPFVLLTLLAAVTLWTSRRRHPIAFLGFWFFLILAPTSSFLPIVSEPIAERRMYLPILSPLLFSFVAFANLMDWGLRRASRNRELDIKRLGRVVVSVGMIVAVAYASMSYARNNVYESELSFWTDVAEKRPLNVRALASLGMLQFEAGNVSESELTLLQALRVDDRSVDAHVNLGSVYMSQKRLDAARFHFDRALQLEPKHGHALSNLGSWYLEAKEPQQALAYVDWALEIMPGHAKSVYNRALALASLGRSDDAIQEYLRALKLDPKMPNAYNNIGHIELTRGNLDTAVDFFIKAIDLEPTSSSAYTNLGTVYAQREQYSVAADYYEKALKFAPSQIDAHYNLGISYAMLGRLDEAVNAYRRCLEFDPQDVGAWINLGIALKAQGKKEDARAAFQQAIQVDPSATEALRELETIDER